MKFYTSDTHFGHFNIIKYSQRPFASTHEMDAVIIENWNSIVSDRDEIFHLGDFALARPERVEDILKQLKGKKYLIYGNHDKVFHKYPHLKTYFVECNHIMDIYEQDNTEKHGRVPITLCHYSMRVWNRSFHGSLQFYGHSHGTLPGTSKSCDVGVDCWDFKPVTYKQIKLKLNNASINTDKQCDKFHVDYYNDMLNKTGE